MKRILISLVAVVAAFVCALAQTPAAHIYETVPNDPLQTRIYTLPNGLKVFMTLNPQQPRIQTYIAVRAGSKNDPAETTGLAHYLEHLMFKGTASFGTQNYATERPLLDSIRSLYEYYRTLTDADARKACYHRIDSISYEASKWAIANEYDKLMATIGANGTNAYTFYDQTVYEEDIPANEVENWARVQADRFQNMVIRGFHTELESVYEEKNISMASDNEKAFDATLALLFPDHPYGTQTTIGTQEHLKNPSIVNIENYYRQYYVPNNVAICMSGDIDAEATIATIEKYFGAWVPNPSVPVIAKGMADDITPARRDTSVVGQENEMLIVGWRLPGASSREAEVAEVVAQMLSNGQAGLMDLDINQQQTALMAGIELLTLADHSAMFAYGLPTEGQSLDQLRALMLKEMQKLAEGQWDNSLLEAVKSNMKLERQQVLESNSARAEEYVNAFVNGIEWHDAVAAQERMARVTRQDIVDFARKWLTEERCVTAYKRQGIDDNLQKIEKPAISPIEMNREESSVMLREIRRSEVTPIAPVFVDFERDVTGVRLPNGNSLVYKKNTTNDIFTQTFIYPRGSYADRTLPFAADFLNYLGTKKLSADEIQSRFYLLACSADITVSDDETYITLTGLEENREAALRLLNEWLHRAVADRTTYEMYAVSTIKERQDSKLEQKTCANQLRKWGIYGADAVRTMSDKELCSTKPSQLLKNLRKVLALPCTTTYYGPADYSQFVSDRTPSTPLVDARQQVVLPHHMAQRVDSTEIILAPYDAKNSHITLYANRGEEGTVALLPSLTLFDTYFGDGMNAIVFQEMRESRGLAYSAGAAHLLPSHRGDAVPFLASVITQNDKMREALSVFHDILERMPVSEVAFPLAKDALLKRLASERYVGNGVIRYYLASRDAGRNSDVNADIYRHCSTMTLQDVIDYQQQHIKGNPYRILILGNKDDLDMDYLRTLGTIREVTLEEIFGY